MVPRPMVFSTSLRPLGTVRGRRFWFLLVPCLYILGKGHSSLLSLVVAAAGENVYSFSCLFFLAVQQPHPSVIL